MPTQVCRPPVRIPRLLFRWQDNFAAVQSLAFDGAFGNVPTLSPSRVSASLVNLIWLIVLSSSSFTTLATLAEGVGFSLGFAHFVIVKPPRKR